MNEREATDLLQASARGVPVRPVPMGGIVRLGARTRRRRRATAALLAAAVCVVLALGGAAAVRLGSDRAEVAPSASVRQLVQGQWLPVTLFGKDVSGFRTVDGAPAYVTFGPVFVSAEYGFNSGGGRYRIGADGHMTVRDMVSSAVGCRGDRHRCPVIRTAEALEAARQVKVRGDRLELLDDGGDVIATYRRAP